MAGSELTRQAVHLIETGKVRPTARSLRLIAQRLGLSESDLLAVPGSGSDRDVISELQELCQRQDYTDAAERALGLIRRAASPERTAYAHHYRGLALYELGKSAEALVHLREALQRFERLGNTRWVAESMDWEAIALHDLQNQTALRVARRALRRYRSLEPRQPETEARILEHLGTIHYRRREYGPGRAYYEAALGVEGGVRDLARIARIYHGLGMCYHGLKELRRAADLVFKALALYEAQQRISPAQMRRGLPAAENDLGTVMIDLGDHDRAEELLRAALDHFGEAGVERPQSFTLLSLGELRLRQDRLDEAFGLFKQAIERAAAFDESHVLTAGYRHLGELYAARGDDVLADASFQRALLLCESAGLGERAREYVRIYERVLSERRQGRRRTRGASA